MQLVTKDLRTSNSFSLMMLVSVNGASLCVSPEPYDNRSGGDTHIRCVSGWKFIDGLGSGGFTAPCKMDPVHGGPKGQLYLTKSDPQESSNLFLQHPDIVKNLQKELHKQMQASIR